jgi:hypothetical protein
MVDFDPSMLLKDAPELRATGYEVYRGVVTRVDEPFVGTPVKVPASYLEENGARTPDMLATPWTPFEVTVSETVLGEPLSSFVTADFGCIGADALPTTTLDSDLLFVVETVAPDLGVSGLFGGTHRLIGWYGIDKSGVLTERLSVWGNPPIAPFLVGQKVDEAIELLKAE